MHGGFSKSCIVESRCWTSERARAPCGHEVLMQGSSKSPKKSLQISKNRMSASGIEVCLVTTSWATWNPFSTSWRLNLLKDGDFLEDPESQTTKNLALISLRHGRSQGQKQKARRSVWKWDRPNLKDILDCFMNLGKSNKHSFRLHLVESPSPWW